jgi:hypothetical protein
MRPCILQIVFALTAVSTAAGQLVSADKERLLRAMLPPVSDARLERAFSDERLLLYTDDEIPPAYQRGGRFVRVQNGVGTDGNFRFPWATPGGMQRVSGCSTFKFISLPYKLDPVERDLRPERWPIVYMQAKLDRTRDQQANSIAWTFPVGTIVGEVLALPGPDGTQYPFEVRVRTREVDDWDVEIYRPFPTAESLAEGIAYLGGTVPASLEVDSTLPIRRLRDSDNDRPILNGKSGVFNLPKLPPQLVHDLLTQATFEPVLSETFGRFKGSAVAPSNAAGFNIVPPKYDGAFIGNTREDCAQCHETVGAAQVRFDNDWNGHVKGSDGIFSFRPGTTDQQGRFIPRRELVEAGVVARFDSTIHPSSVYSPIPKLRHDND